MIKNYGIGGNEVPTDAFESVADIPQNRTLMVEKLTDQQALKPDIIEGLQTPEAVFEHFKPNVDLEFETLEGMPVKENLRFRNLGDFGDKGITNQSSYLQNATVEKEENLRIVKLLKSNKVLRDTVANPEKRRAFTDVLQSLINELKSVK